MSRSEDLEDLRFLGTGPSATGSTPGWRLTEDLYFRCSSCGELISGDPRQSERCSCGSLVKDGPGGRIESRLGERAIEVFEKGG
ncbi:MAG: hypothetical protein R3234_09815 [Thermoanaerobaculia bacterium]|nr:hypothetical protein [Thermoanaerobaculia bacterium]